MNETAPTKHKNGAATLHDGGTRANEAIVHADGPVGSAKLAEVLGCDESTVRRHAREWGGKRGPDGWQFSVEKVTRRLTLSAKKKEGPDAAERGEIAARAFEAFERGDALTSVVRSLRRDPDEIERLFKRWLDLQRVQREALIPRCHFEHRGDCAGGIVLQEFMCAHHASRARVLSDEERRVLASEEIPDAVHCTACGGIADHGVCSNCVGAIEVVGEPGRVLVRMGGKVIAVVSRTRALELMGPVPEAPPAETAPVVMGATAGRSSITEEIARLRRETGVEAATSAPTSPATTNGSGVAALVEQMRADAVAVVEGATR